MAAPLDCPLRDAPFSSRSPLIDLLLSPRAAAILRQRVPDLGRGLPADFLRTEAPSFAAILTVRDVVKGPDASVQLERLDRALAAVPVTAEDRRQRCARYDDDRPAFKLSAGRPRFLLFEKINGFRDSPSVDAAHAAFVTIARRHGWALASTDRGGAINAATLRSFDAVIWNNISGDVLTLSQRAALRRFVERGGGFVAVHGSAGDPATFWDWYSDRLIGARFLGHPMSPQFQAATIRLEDRSGPVTSGLPPSWSMTDEWYSFRANPRASGAHVLATLDERSYRLVGMNGEDLRMGDHPIAWTRMLGRGRVFYSAIGHRPEQYAEPLYLRMLDQAMRWTARARR
ncbi:ThuA domain-containing protein [Sphingomonas ginkgonis]|nr:ThuA domain-containing protein [Sphingomonas ginkgonis]